MGLWQPHQRDTRGFMERNAGKLLIAAFLAPVPMRLLVMATDSVGLGLFVLLIDAILLIMSITGYVQRLRRRR